MQESLTKEKIVLAIEKETATVLGSPCDWRFATEYHEDLFYACIGENNNFQEDPKETSCVVICLSIPERDAAGDETGRTIDSQFAQTAIELRALALNEIVFLQALRFKIAKAAYALKTRQKEELQKVAQEEFHSDENYFVSY